MQELHSVLRMFAHKSTCASQREAPPLESTYAHRVATSTLYMTAAGCPRCACVAGPAHAHSCYATLCSAEKAASP